MVLTVDYNNIFDLKEDLARLELWFSLPRWAYTKEEQARYPIEKYRLLKQINIDQEHIDAYRRDYDCSE